MKTLLKYTRFSTSGQIHSVWYVLVDWLYNWMYNKLRVCCIIASLQCIRMFLGSGTSEEKGAFDFMLSQFISSIMSSTFEIEAML